MAPVRDRLPSGYSEAFSPLLWTWGECLTKGGRCRFGARTQQFLTGIDANQWVRVRAQGAVSGHVARGVSPA